MTSLQIEAAPSTHLSAASPISSSTTRPQSSVLHTAEVVSTADFSKPPLSHCEPRFSKAEIRQSLKASTLDGTFSSAFENVVRGVLISNFLLGLGADAFEVGLLTSIPMLAHLLQPLGAYFSERVTSRHQYCLWVYGASRLLWLLPAAGIFLYGRGSLDAHHLTLVTMTVLALSNMLDSIGSASWMSWMAALVPAQVRGRYFSLRRSLSSLAALLTIPIGGWIVSEWMGGEIEGYGVALVIAVAMGVASLSFQFWISDINPQAEADVHKDEVTSEVNCKPTNSIISEDNPTLLADRNFLRLLLFLGLWTFGLSLCKPFFNFYLLDSLTINVQWVTLYSGLVYGTFFLMITLWGRLADRIGNRPILLVNCLLTALSPLLWLCTDSSQISIWFLFPLLHVLQGGTFAALELSTTNIQMELAPTTRQSGYFAIAAATIGITGALGTTLGGILAELPNIGLTGLFVISALVRLVSISPLLWVEEARAISVRDVINQQLQHLPTQWQPARVKA